VHVDGTLPGYGVGIDIQALGRDRIRFWEYRLGTAYISEFAQALPEGGTVRIESIEGLLRVEWGTKKRDTATYIVQIVDKPHQVFTLKA